MKKSTMKKSIVLCILVCMAIFAGCGTSGVKNNEEQKPQKSSQEESKSEKDSEEKKPEEEIT